MYGGCRQKSGRRPEGLGGTMGQLRGWSSQLGLQGQQMEPPCLETENGGGGGRGGEESLNCEAST